MEPETSRLRERSEAALEVEAAATASVGGLECATVEELLRHDASGVEVPPAVEARLAASVAREGLAKPAWWRRLF